MKIVMFIIRQVCFNLPLSMGEFWHFKQEQARAGFYYNQYETIFKQLFHNGKMFYTADFSGF